MSMRKSLIWSYGSQAANLFVSFLSSVAIARMLDPHEFGVFAFAMAAMGFIGVFTSLNLGSYLVREEQLSRQQLSSLFTLNACEIIIFCMAILIASLVEWMAGAQREISIVLAISVLSPLISIFEFIPASLYQREMDFATLSKVAVIRNVITSIAAVCAVAYGLGAVGLAVGPAVGSLFSVTYFNVRRYRDTIFIPTRRGLRPAFVYGLQIMSISGVAQLAQRISDLSLGRILGLSALGLYSRASNLAGMVFTGIYGQATSVVFVRMAQDLREHGSFHVSFLGSLRMITAAIWPMMIGIAILSRPLIHSIYGGKWDAAAAPLSILMLAQFVVLGFGMNWEVFVLRHQTASQTRFELIRAVCGVALFVGGCFFGIAGAAASRVAEALIGYCLYRPHMDKLVGTRTGEIEIIFRESLGLTAVAVSPALLLMILGSWSYQTPFALVLASVAAGIALWLLAVRHQKHPLFAELLFVRNRLRTD